MLRSNFRCELLSEENQVVAFEIGRSSRANHVEVPSPSRLLSISNVRSRKRQLLPLQNRVTPSHSASPIANASSRLCRRAVSSGRARSRFQCLGCVGGRSRFFGRGTAHRTVSAFYMTGRGKSPSSRASFNARRGGTASNSLGSHHPKMGQTVRRCGRPEESASYG